MHARLSDGTTLAICRYEPFESHDPHAHDGTSISFVLAGGVAEQVRGVTRRGCGLDTVVKPSGTEHANRFGPSGALLVQIGLGRTSSPAPWFWAPTLAPDRWLILTRVLLSPTRQCRLSEAFAGVTASFGNHPRAPAPEWLHDAQEEIRNAPHAQVRDLAARHGLHEVTFAREFRKHFRVSPRELRVRGRVSHAMELLWKQPHRPLASVAAACGFADQPHMNRGFRAVLGMRPTEFVDLVGGI